MNRLQVRLKLVTAIRQLLIKVEPVDGWASAMRDNVWAPLGIGVSMQWIILGLFVGVQWVQPVLKHVLCLSMLIPESHVHLNSLDSLDFIGKAAAMIGPILYAISSRILRQ